MTRDSPLLLYPPIKRERVTLKTGKVVEVLEGACGKKYRIMAMPPAARAAAIRNNASNESTAKENNDA